jgi:acyl dehydratase
MDLALTPGTSLPERRCTLGSADLVAYAGATWDWHRLHHDQAYARSIGFPAPVVDGQLFGALLVEQLQDALGPSAFVRELDVRYRAPVFVDETVRCEATVTAVDGGHLELQQRVVVVGAEADDREAVTATAVVEVPS